jgi:serine/threonine protein kinase
VTPAVDDTSLAGSRFGDYEILEELGAGGMGKVYRARDLTLDRVVALKMLPEAHLKDPVFVQRFLKEARAAARLNHPNIVQIYNFGSVDGTYYLAMEFVGGHSLGHHLRERRFSENEALDLVRQACRALAVAHAEGLVHRDIKPDNLMLTERGEVKLVDLGIAKRIDEDQAITQTGFSVGTPHYISPEQIRGQKDIDARADIYSLGATLYHLVTGHRPFEGTSGAHVMSMHLVDPLPDPRRYVPELSEGICRVLRKMMAKDREERYPDIAILEVDLHRIRAGQTPRPSEPSVSAVATSVLEGRAAPAARPAFDPTTLAKIEENLATSIGPMARIIVRKTARTAVSLEALCEELARQLAPGSDREAFCAKCLACDKPLSSSAAPGSAEKTPPSGGRPSTSLPLSAVPPGPGAPRAASDPGHSRAPAAWNDADLATLEAELAKQIGPLAKVLLKKALKNAPTPGDLVSKLEENIPGEEGRRAFRAAVRHLAP